MSEESTSPLRKIVRYSIRDEELVSLANKGIFFLVSEINDAIASDVLIDLLMHNMKFPGKDVWIFLDSPGGEVGPGLAIFDTVKMITGKGTAVNIIGIGEVCSMAVAVMQAGTRRYCFPNTQFLVHQIRQRVIKDDEETTEIEERAEEVKRINNAFLKIIAERSGVDIDELRKLARKKDYWLDAQTASKLGTSGLVDEIIDTLPFNMNGR